jgi:hypothetical protein
MIDFVSPTIGFVTGAAAALAISIPMLRPRRLSAEQGERVEVLADNGKPLRLQMVSGTGGAGIVEIAPRRAVILAGELLLATAGRL